MSGFGGIGPIDYSGLQNQPDALGSFGQGVQTTMQIQQLFAAQQAAQVAAQRQAEMEDYLEQLSMNPNATGRDYAQAAVRFPEVSAELKQAWDTLGPEQQQAELKVAGGIYAALSNGRPEIAAQQARERAAALMNSGNAEEAAEFTELAEAIEEDPIHARAQVGIRLAGVNPEKFQETYKALGEEERAGKLAPDAQRKAKADADSAEVAAQNAPEKARLDLAKASEEVRASKENTRLRALEATLTRETNDLKRQELQQKINAAQKEVDIKAAERIAEADTAVAGLDDSAALVRGLLADKARLKTAIGGLAIRGAIPGTEARAVAGDLERLQNSLAAANLDKLKGAMSDKDILFLKSISTNLDRYQDEGAFIRELERVEKVITDNRTRVVKKYGESVPVEKRQSPSEPTVDDLLTKYGAK